MYSRSMEHMKSDQTHELTINGAHADFFYAQTVKEILEKVDNNL